jgi:hypothetical protein
MTKHCRSFLWWVAPPEGKGFSVRTDQADRLVVRRLLERTSREGGLTSACTATEAGLRAVGRGQVPVEFDEPVHPAARFGDRDIWIMDELAAKGSIRDDDCPSYDLKAAGLILGSRVESRGYEDVYEFTLSPEGEEAMRRHAEAMDAWRERTASSSPAP